MNISRIALVVTALVSLDAWAQTASSLLVDVEWLAQHLNDRDLVVLHVEDKSGYNREHIPGARFVEMAHLDEHMTRDGLLHELPAPDVLRAAAASLGISDDSRIVVYVGNEGGVESATRILFALDYLGVGERTALLNGGLAAWKQAGKPVTAAVPPARPGTLTARPTKDVVVDAGFVTSLGKRAGHKLVDARAAMFFQGVQGPGHIPGAISIPFTHMTDNRQMMDRTRIAAVFREAGIGPGDTIVVYCHIGQQATAVMFGARLLGHPVKLYDGSFQDWSTNKRGPVEK